MEKAAASRECKSNNKPLKLAPDFRPLFDTADCVRPINNYLVMSQCTINHLARIESEGKKAIIASKASFDLGNLIRSLPEAVREILSKLPEKLKAIGRRLVDTAAPKPLEGAKVLEDAGLVASHTYRVGPAILRTEYTLTNKALLWAPHTPIPNGQWIVQRRVQDLELLPQPGMYVVLCGVYYIQ